MKLIKVVNERGEERQVERPVAENMVSMFPKSWKIIEAPIKKPKEKREETN